jgi:quercetin dioxygenase-like cupin family protein
MRDEIDGGERQRRRAPAISICLLVPLIFLACNAHADDAAAPQVERKILAKHDLSGVPGKEAVIGTATFPPGAVIGFHTHPGDESGYIIAGSVTVRIRGASDLSLKAGDGFFNPRSAVHSVVAGPEGATIVATWIVDKGVPMSSPVP